jgi:Raf kinase inhibitor-like YbhB/YbcL family protein
MFLRNYCLYLALLASSVLLIHLPAYAESSDLSLQSAAFAANGPIPITYTCSGDNKSPALTWSGLPPATKTAALIVRDPDAPMGSFVHWVLYNVPANVTKLPSAIPTTRTLDNGASQGANGSGAIGYHGPCPPPGSAHHYHFRLYALDATLDLTPGAKADEVEQAIKGHVLASTDLVGTFAR